MAQAKGRTTQRKRSGEASGKEQVTPEPTVDDTTGASAAAEHNTHTPEEHDNQREEQDKPADEQPDLDLARFTGAPAAEAETPTQQGAATPEVEPSGQVVQDPTGASAEAEAVVLVDMYSITTTGGRFITARKGDTVKTSVEAVQRGVRLGMLREA